MKNRILYLANEKIAVIIPALNSKRPNENEEDFLKRTFEKAQQNIPFIEFEDVEDSTLPSREFRNAWRGSKITGIKIDSTEKQKIENERKINNKIESKQRNEAINDLQISGDLPADYT